MLTILVESVLSLRISLIRGCVLDLGEVVAEGDVKELLEEDTVRRIYLGLT